METPNTSLDDWEELLAQYSVGAMEPDEAAKFAAALDQCRARTALAAAVGQVAGLIGTVPSPVEPPAGHKLRLMQRIASTPQQAVAEVGADQLVRTDHDRPVQQPPARRVPVRRRAGAWAWAAAAAAIVIVALGVWLVDIMGRAAQQEASIGQLRSQVSRLQQQVNIPPGYRTIALAPTAEYSGSSAIALFDPGSNQLWLVADGLKPLPDDLVYELWLIQPPGQGRSDVGGVFESSDTGTAVHTTAANRKIADYAGFAVSIERKPGVPVREGPVVVVGRFSGE